MGEPVQVELTKDEALVLFDFLSRFMDEEKLDIKDQAEARALWNLQCLLEKQIADIFNPELRTIISAARDRLRDLQD